MKKQIIIIVSVAVLTALLFTAYGVFFNKDYIATVQDDPIYSITDASKDALESLDKKATLIVSGYNPDDSDWNIIYLYAKMISETNKRVKFKEDDLGFSGIRVEIDGESKDINFDDFFKVRFDGARYAFDGEALLVNAILELSGSETLEIPLRAMKNYDTDGDNVTGNGLPFMFPSIDREQIKYLDITNSHGNYQIIQEGGTFYFADSSAVSYDDELFAELTTNCRHTVSYGKMLLPEGRSWEDYGINQDGGVTASYSIMTTEAEDGSYSLHTVYIGNLASSGQYYYARYIGGIIKKDGEESVNLSKDFVYFFPVDAVDNSISNPQTAIMRPYIVEALSQNEILYGINNIKIDDFKTGVSVVAKSMYDFNPADNLSAIDNTSITTVISDKKKAGDYNSYSDGWINHKDVFGGFTSSDGKTTYIEAAIARVSKTGEYRVEFGLLRDEANGAYVPGKIYISKSTDGVNWYECGGVVISQTDKSIKNYEFSFTESEAVKYLRLTFDVPQKANTYVVIDEVRIYGGNDDLQPYSAISGRWKLVAPSSLIQPGKNYEYLDMSNFNDLVQGFAMLEGEKVVDFGFSKGGDASVLDTEKLKKYRLDNPDKRYVFEYEGVTTELFVSESETKGKYYAYTTFSFVSDGEHNIVSTDVIVELSSENVKWLAWDTTDCLDHSLFSTYLVDITQMTITADGKEHIFDVIVDADDTVSDIKYQGKSYDVQSFKYLYEQLLKIYMQDEYTPEDGEEKTEYFSIKVVSETETFEIEFYTVSATKCYYTVDGEGSYYVFVQDINKAIDKLNAYVSGEILGSDR